MYYICGHYVIPTLWISPACQGRHSVIKKLLREPGVLLNQMCLSRSELDGVTGES